MPSLNCAKMYYFQVLKLAYYREHRSSSVKDFKIFIDIQKIVQLFSLQTIEGGAAEPAADCGFFFISQNGGFGSATVHLFYLKSQL